MAATPQYSAQRTPVVKQMISLGSAVRTFRMSTVPGDRGIFLWASGSFSIIPLAAVSGWWAAKRSNAHRGISGPTSDLAFFRGLNYLLDGQPDKKLSISSWSSPRWTARRRRSTWLWVVSFGTGEMWTGLSASIRTWSR